MKKVIIFLPKGQIEYKTEDDIGDSYYFRGDVENNYVYFSGFSYYHLFILLFFYK